MWKWQCEICPVQYYDHLASLVYIEFNSEVNRFKKIQELYTSSVSLTSKSNSAFLLIKMQTTNYSTCDVVAKRNHKYSLTTLQSFQISQIYLLCLSLLQNYGSYTCHWLILFNNEFLIKYISQFQKIWLMYFTKSGSLCHPAYFILHI